MSEHEKYADAKGIEAAILERDDKSAIRYRTVATDEIAAAVAG